MANPDKLTLKITQASLNQTALDWPRNMTNIYAAVDEAVAQGSDILSLEELTVTGYEANDEFQRTDNDRILASLQDIAAYANALDPNLIISVGHPWRAQIRDMPAPTPYSFERVKDPLYDRLNLPFNVQSIVSGGAIHAMTAKNNLYNDGRGYEKRYFNEWSMTAADRLGGVFGTVRLPLEQGPSVPFGTPIVHVSDGTIGFNLAQVICESKWVATKYDGHPHDDSRYETDNMIPSFMRYLGSKQGLVILLPSDSPPAPNKVDQHIHLNKLASRYADAAVDTDGLGSSGSTFAQFGQRMIAQGEKITSYGSRLSFARVATTTSTIQINPTPPKTIGKTHATLAHKFNNKTAPVQMALIYETDDKQAWDSPANPNRHFEEVMRNIALWLFDYMRKAAGSRGIAEALSGGADSAFNSVVLCAAVHLAIDELGVEKFCDELRLAKKQKILDAEKAGGQSVAAQACLEELLTGVYMATNNSSVETRNAAEFLLNGGTNAHTGEQFAGVGGKFIYRNIQDLVNMWGVVYAVQDTTKIEPVRKAELIREISAYMHANPRTTTSEERAAMAAALKIKYPEIEQLVTAADGAVYENIQAQARDLIWAFANKEGKMPVANPNLDEARNGYTTFSADLHGGAVNLNAGLNKDYQLQLMRYLYEHGLQGVMPPIRAFGPILENRPSAELLPKDKDGKVVQHDEDALQRSFKQMNRISEFMLYHRKNTANGARRLNASEVFGCCQQDELFSGVTDNILYNMVRKSYFQWGIAQWKIHAGPTAPTLGRNVDQQTSQRTPVISGQSKDELAILGIHLLFKWAEQEGLSWAEADKQLLERRAWQDEKFVHTFDRHVWNSAGGMDYNLETMYRALKIKGWSGLFEPLNDHHPVAVCNKPLSCTPDS